MIQLRQNFPLNKIIIPILKYTIILHSIIPVTFLHLSNNNLIIKNGNMKFKIKIRWSLCPQAILLLHIYKYRNILPITFVRNKKMIFSLCTVIWGSTALCDLAMSVILLSIALIIFSYGIKYIIIPISSAPI